MEGKISLRKNARWITGLIFALLGGLFCVMGIVIYFLPDEERIAGVAMALIGVLFFTGGLYFVTWELCHLRMARKLAQEGRCVWGEVWDVVPDSFIKINNAHPHYVLVRYTDQLRQIHTFRSRSLRIPRRTDLVGRRVRVYVDGNNFSRYHVDVESILFSNSLY